MSRFYSQKITVTDSNQEITLQPYQSFNFLNTGGKNCQFNFDAEVDNNSPTLLQYNSYNYKAGSGFNKLNLKCATGESTTVELTMVKQFK